MTDLNARTADPVSIVQSYLEAFGSGDVEATLKWVHPDAVWRVDGQPGLVPVGLIRGREGVRGWLMRFGKGIAPMTFSVNRWLSDAQTVVALGRFRLRVKPALGLVDSDYALRFDVKDGMVVRYQMFEDSFLLGAARVTSDMVRQNRINGTDYTWEDRGQGTSVILLHGLFLSREAWAPVVRDLASDHRVIAFDMPGHGQSGWRDGLDLDTMADDLALWIEENGAEPAILIGHSQGGMVALRMAARYPHLVARLVLMNTSARAEYSERLEDWTAKRDQLLKKNPTSAKALEAAVLYRKDVTGELNAISAPVHVLAGAEDHATPPELGQEIATGVQQGRCDVIPSLGHHILIDQPQAVMDAVRGA